MTETQLDQRQSPVNSAHHCVDCGCSLNGVHRLTLRCAGCNKLKKRAKDNEYKAGNRERLAAYSRSWYASNTLRANETNRARAAKASAENPDLHKERYAKEREKRLARANAYYAANREKVLARLSTDHGRALARARENKKRQDSEYRLHTNVSRCIRTSLKSKARRSWETLVGYTCEDLIAHLERQFTKGMTWDNMGEWHVDHIVPRSSFSYQTADDDGFKACWALTNLRPLWATENYKKHAKRLHLI